MKIDTYHLLKRRDCGGRSPRRWASQARMRRIWIAFVLMLPLLGCTWNTEDSTNGCVVNLKELDGLKAVWAMKFNKATNDMPSEADLLNVDTSKEHIPTCPGGGTYTIGRIGDPPSCTISEHTAYFHRVSVNRPTREEM